MIKDAREVPAGEILQCDVCIVGGGPAGISIAKELAGTLSHVIVVEAGDRKETAQAKDLYRGFVEPSSSHEPLEENRRRQWGGGTAVWGGRCIPFDAIDFEKREWVPYSGWPITKSDLDPYFARASRLCEVGECKFKVEETFPEKQREMIAGFDGVDVVSNCLERWSPPTHFGKRYARDLKSAANITVFLNANCLHIQLTAYANKAEQIEVASFERNKFFIQARVFIIACGALETARLLLASNDVMSRGIGNHSDSLGRYYMAHLHGAVAVAKLKDNAHAFVYDFERDGEGVHCRRRFWITPEAQRKNQILNGIGFFFRPPLSHAVQGKALFSAAFLAKFLLNAFKRNSVPRAIAILGERRSDINAHLRIVMGSAPGLIPQVASIIRNRYFARRRLPFVLPPQSYNNYHLFYQSEHAPNPNSRVILHAEKDVFGMPRLLVKIAFTDLDVQTVMRAHRLIRNQFAATHTGELIYEESGLLEDVNQRIAAFSSVAHQIGTTRMSSDPREGVVDANCRVHGIDNLFVAGASVFPTSGHANPTLTLVALAVRLADHLKEALNKSIQDFSQAAQSQKT